jgi:hypothetical protein
MTWRFGLALAGFSFCLGCSRQGLPSAPDNSALAECPLAAATPAAPASPPTLLADGQLNPSELAVDTDNVYWANAGTSRLVSTERTDPNADGSIVAVSKAGGVARTLVGGLRGPAHLALGSSHIYVSTSDGAILRISKAGGSAVALASGRKVVALAIDASRVYWADEDGSVQAMPLVGGDPTTLAKGQSPFGLVVGDDVLFWANHDDTVMKLRKEGGSPTVLLSGEGTPTRLAVCSGRLYYATAFSRVLKSVSTDGQAPQTFATPINVQGIALDQSNLFVSRLEGGLQAWPTQSAGSAHTLVSQQPGTGALTVDDTDVYWIVDASSNGGQIWRRSK